jgi:hypothetical protein
MQNSTHGDEGRAPVSINTMNINDNSRNNFIKKRSNNVFSSDNEARKNKKALILN